MGVGVFCALLLFLFNSTVSYPEVALSQSTVRRHRLLLRGLGVPHRRRRRRLAFALGGPHDDARPRRLGGARRAATVALVLLLRALDLPFPELPLVEVEGCQGDQHDPHEHDQQHEERQGGGERREDAQLLGARAVPVQGAVAAVWRRQPRGLRATVHVDPATLVSLGSSAVACRCPGSARRQSRAAHVLSCGLKVDTHGTNERDSGRASSLCSGQNRKEKIG